MTYNVEWLNLKIGQPNLLFFWGNGEPKSEVATKNCLSQWQVSPFIVDDITYETAEHWMMAKKAMLFNDYENLNKILATQSPAEAKILGRAIKNYNEDTWLANRFEIVKQGNYHKFEQNASLKKFLLNTADVILVEATPDDRIWGIGLTHDDPNASNPKKWNGLNLLGFALMKVRDELRKSK